MGPNHETAFVFTFLLCIGVYIISHIIVGLVYYFTKPPNLNELETEVYNLLTNKSLYKEWTGRLGNNQISLKHRETGHFVILEIDYFCFWGAYIKGLSIDNSAENLFLSNTVRYYLGREANKVLQYVHAAHNRYYESVVNRQTKECIIIVSNLNKTMTRETMSAKPQG